ncbi:hypothetical protein HOY80DRAFT_968756 [Tuber brumale]|nr:hypothetical protein HOY80DRAFT_968756 [Tuber brumale]
MLLKTFILFTFMVFLTITSTNFASSSAIPAPGPDSKEIEDLMATAATTFDSPSAESWRRCETSDASPTLADIYYAVLALHQQGGMCCNGAIHMNECTNIIAFGGADIGFCGIQSCIPCIRLGAEVWWMAVECRRDGKAGGVAFLHDTSYIVTY